jgi:hypothetical protein
LNRRAEPGDFLFPKSETTTKNTWRFRAPGIPELDAAGLLSGCGASLRHGVEGETRCVTFFASGQLAAKPWRFFAGLQPECANYH